MTSPGPERPGFFEVATESERPSDDVIDDAAERTANRQRKERTVAVAVSGAHRPLPSTQTCDVHSHDYNGSQRLGHGVGDCEDQGCNLQPSRNVYGGHLNSPWSPLILVQTPEGIRCLPYCPTMSATRRPFSRDADRAGRNGFADSATGSDITEQRSQTPCLAPVPDARLPRMSNEQSDGDARGEGRFAFAGSVSIAWATETGPRDNNQDHALCRFGEADSWLIAVADGAGGRPRGRASARSAIRSLPKQIDSTNIMSAAFEIANDAVGLLTPSHLRMTLRDTHLCPATMLCVAAWGPGTGPIVGIAGDTVPVLLWQTENEEWHGRTLGQALPGVSGGEWTRYLGASAHWRSRQNWTPRDPIELLTEDDIELPGDRYTIAILSDGVWGPIVDTAVADAVTPAVPLGAALAASLRPDDQDAHRIATRIMNTARKAGLHDNATVAVACADES